MTSSLIWLLPALASLLLLFALARLGKVVKRLNRQTTRLQKSLEKFQNTDHSNSKKAFIFSPISLEKAETNRRSFLKQRAEAKQERQRRLVKRLSNLKSKESE